MKDIYFHKEKEKTADSNRLTQIKFQQNHSKDIK
jgi:hypothetical protein